MPDACAPADGAAALIYGDLEVSPTEPHEFSDHGGPGQALGPVVVVTRRVDDVKPINELLERDTLVVLAPRVESAAQFVRQEPVPPQPGPPQQGPHQPVQSLIEIGDLTINLSEHSVRWRGTYLDMSEQEIGILACLAGRAGHALSFAEMFRHVWGTSGRVDRAVLHSAVQRLRRKLAAARATIAIQSVRGYGFRLGGLS
jgi:DNA-binding response OmpR family regulator